MSCWHATDKHEQLSLPAGVLARRLRHAFLRPHLLLHALLQRILVLPQAAHSLALGSQRQLSRPEGQQDRLSGTASRAGKHVVMPVALPAMLPLQWHP